MLNKGRKNDRRSSVSWGGDYLMIHHKLQISSLILVGVGELDGDAQFSRGDLPSAKVQVPIKEVSRLVLNELQFLMKSQQVKQKIFVVCDH